MTCRATFRFHWRVFVRERTLLVRMAFDTACICSRREARLFEFKSAVRVMTIAAPHRAFQNLVMERHVELRLYFVVTTRAKLRVIRLQHAHR